MSWTETSWLKKPDTKLIVFYFTLFLALWSIFRGSRLVSWPTSSGQIGYPKTDDDLIQRLDKFKANHVNILSKLEPARFVYIKPDTGGYGNKMIQFISAFMVAMLTDSAVIINITHIDKFVYEPLPGCFRTDKAARNELNFLYRPNDTYWFPKGTQNGWKYNKTLKNLYTHIPTNLTRYVFDGMSPIYFELGCNPDYYQNLLHYGLVQKETIERAVVMLNDTRNVFSHDIKLNNLYRVGFEVAHNILRLFWRPSLILQNKIDEFVEKKFKGHFVIGLQLRFEFLELQDVKSFINCAIQIEQDINTTKSVKWFVTTDNSHVLLNITQLHPNRVIYSDGLISHVGVDPNAYARSILDVELLSKCNEVILTGGSTYGFLSSMRSGKYPYIINGRRNWTSCEYFAFSNPSQNPSGYSFI